MALHHEGVVRFVSLQPVRDGDVGERGAVSERVFSFLGHDVVQRLLLFIGCRR